MLRHLFIGTVAALAFAPASTSRHASRPPISAGSLATFDDESGAQAHCSNDQIAWLNTNSGFYNKTDMAW